MHLFRTGSSLEIRKLLVRFTARPRKHDWTILSLGKEGLLDENTELEVSKLNCSLCSKELVHQ